MPIRDETYAFARPVPYFLVRGGIGGGVQTLSAPIRDGAEGSLVAPDADSTISIEKADDTELVSGATVTAVTSSTAQYDLTLSSSETLGAGWTILWDLSFSGVAYPTFRQSAYVVDYVPPNVISAVDLYGELPELRHRIPQSQGERGDDVGWQPQIDAAYYELLQLLIDDGRRPWLIREVTGYREWCLARALQRCVQAIPYKGDSTWAQASKELAFRLKRARAGLRFQYSDEDADVRRAASPVITLGPVARVSWW